MKGLRILAGLTATLCALSTGSAATSLKVEVVLLTMDDAVWQHTFLGGAITAEEVHQKAMTLAASGAVKVPASATLVVPEAQEARWQQGKDVSFAAGWSHSTDRPSALVALEETTRFIGSKISLTWASNPLNVKLSLRHDTPRSESTSQVYDTKAGGNDRAAVSVMMPTFDTLQWDGTAILKVGQWTRAACMLRPSAGKDEMARRFVLLIKGGKP